jgi:hypothetical protein
MVLVPAHWGNRIVALLTYVKIPVICYQYEAISGQMVRVYPPADSTSAVGPPYVLHPNEQEAPPMLRMLKQEKPILDLSFRRGSWELSFRGLPLAWSTSNQAVWFDYLSPRPLDTRSKKEFREHRRIVFFFRRYPPPEPHHPAYRFGHERWLESLVLANLETILPRVSKEVYSQVPTWIAEDRKVLDLLGVTSSGRLAVAELKIDKAIELLFQGFDYWERVAYHLDLHNLQQAGYFKRVGLKPSLPHLYLISPLFDFHRLLPLFREYVELPTEVECVGLNSDWKRGLTCLRRFCL